MAGLSGCGKVPTWNELTGKPAPPTQVTEVPNPAFPNAGQPNATPGQSDDPAAVLAWFKALPPMQMNDQALARVTSLRGGLEAITQIDANGSNVTDQGLQHLGKLPQLEKLSLDGTAVTDEGMKALQRVPSLQAISLNSTRISATGLDSLAALPGLKRLEMMNTKPTQADFEAIGRLPALESLTLNRVLELTDESLDAICHASTLKALQINECVGLTDKGLVALAKVPGLEELTFHKANITGVGIGFAASKGGLKSLKVLAISYAPINLPGARAINSLKTLESLDISFVPGMNDAFFVEFIAGLKHLKELNISANKGILGQGFLKMKACSGTLETLAAQNSGLTDQSLALLKGHKVLKFMDLSNTSVSMTGVQQFKMLIPGCEILYAGTRY